MFLFLFFWRKWKHQLWDRFFFYFSHPNTRMPAKMSVVGLILTRQGLFMRRILVSVWRVSWRLSVKGFKPCQPTSLYTTTILIHDVFTRIYYGVCVHSHYVAFMSYNVTFLRKSNIWYISCCIHSLTCSMMPSMIGKKKTNWKQEVLFLVHMMISHGRNLCSFFTTEYSSVGILYPCTAVGRAMLQITLLFCEMW